MSIFTFLRQSKIRTAYYFAIVLSIITALASVIETWYMGSVLDNLLVMETRAFLFSAGMMIIAVIIQYVSSTANIYLSDWVLQKFNLYWRCEITKKANKIAYGELESFQTGDILSLPVADLDGVGQYMTNVIDKSGGVIASIVALLICININIIFTIFCIIAIVVILGIGMFIASPLQKATLMVKEKRSDVNSRFINILTNLSSIKAYCLEKTIGNIYSDLLELSKCAVKKQSCFMGISSGYGKLSGGLMYLAMFAGGAYFIFKGELSLGRFFAFAYIFSNIQSIQNIQEIMGAYQHAKGSLIRITTFLNKADEADNDIKSTHSENIVSGIYLENVTFAYHQEQTVIKNISLHIKKGQCVAFVGKSGCGKSTLVKLITALYKPNNGIIRLDGAVTTGEIRSKISVVSQKDYLFPTTILENLKMVRPEATDQEIEAACRNAEIYDFIQILPDGLNTFVGELGNKLSGGQRQRLCVARAFLKDAPILILDEPTAALDSFTEGKLLDSLKKLMKDRTTVLISHRLSTIQTANYIYCMEDGEITQEGTLESLLNANSGIFTELFADNNDSTTIEGSDAN